MNDLQNHKNHRSLVPQHFRAAITAVRIWMLHQVEHSHHQGDTTNQHVRCSQSLVVWCMVSVAMAFMAVTLEELGQLAVTASKGSEEK